MKKSMMSDKELACQYGLTDMVIAKGRQRLNLIAICVNLFFPWFLFLLIMSCLSFNLHYTSAGLAKASVAFGVFVTVFALLLGYRAKQRSGDPVWYNFAAFAFAVATLAGFILGDLNYWNHMNAYYSLESLNTYPGVDPRFDKGQQLMDSGRTYFAQGTKLDRKKAVAFKNNDVYCAAPIVNGDEKLATYDFWAVGTNCCSGASSEFHCGEYDNPSARAGLRFVNDIERPFLRLAVQQAEAAYNIKATHPIFFYWLQDPIAEMNSYCEDGYRFFLLGMFAHFAFNGLCVLSAVMSFSKLGPGR